MLTMENDIEEILLKCKVLLLEILRTLFRIECNSGVMLDMEEQHIQLN